jgi:leucyl/phenylalanyl-tRNA--protein transferase
MQACAQPRRRESGTWITDDMFDAYCRLHEEGHAHSIEIRDGNDLVGGIYGIAIGRMFYGESMFSLRDHASKVALLALCRGLAILGFPLLDAQVSSPHLLTLGAYEMPRREFGRRLQDLVVLPAPEASWDRTFSGIEPPGLGRAGSSPGTSP